VDEAFLKKLQDAKLILGYKEVLKGIKDAKVIIYSKSLTKDKLDKLKSLSDALMIPYPKNSLSLGKILGKPFRVSVVALKNVENIEELKRWAKA